MPFIDPEVLTGIGICVGTGIGSYAALKKWPFWKNLNGGAQTEGTAKVQIEKCPEITCHDLVITTATKVAILEEGQSLIFEKLDAMPEKIIRSLREHKGLL